MACIYVSLKKLLVDICAILPFSVPFSVVFGKSSRINFFVVVSLLQNYFFTLTMQQVVP